MREQFEEKYREMRPDDKSTLMPSGNYSGWVKQASWEGWQMCRANAVQKEAQVFEGVSAVTFEEFIEVKHPTRSPKVLFQLDDVDGSKFYMIKEVQDQAEAWQARQAEVDHLTEMNQRYIGKMQEQQDQIAELKAEFNELLAFNENLDRERNTYRDQAQKYKSKVLMVGNLLRDCRDQDMTLKAIKVVVERVGEF